MLIRLSDHVFSSSMYDSGVSSPLTSVSDLSDDEPDDYKPLGRPTKLFDLEELRAALVSGLFSFSHFFAQITQCSHSLLCIREDNRVRLESRPHLRYYCLPPRSRKQPRNRRLWLFRL